MVTLPGAIIPHHLPSLNPLGQAGHPPIKTPPHASSDEGAAPPSSLRTQPLPSLGSLGIRTPLPAIPGGGGLSRLPQIRRPTMDLTNSMPSRRKMEDPFSLEPLSPIHSVPAGDLPPPRLSNGRSPPIPNETQPDTNKMK